MYLAAVDRARETVAKAAGVGFRDVVFTASATEANNLALRGVVRAFHGELLALSGNGEKNLIAHRSKLKAKVIVSAVEHDSVLETARDMERAGEAELAVIPVDRRGILDVKELKAALDERTILVSAMYVNNELGTIQPITEIADVIRRYKSPVNSYPLFHTDAAQAFLYYPCDLRGLGADLMTLSSQKIYGPKGAGALVISPKLETLNSKQISNSKFQNSNVSDLGFRVSDLSRLVSPIVTGGGQEFGLRAGTENIPGIVGFAAAVALAERDRAKRARGARSARDLFVKTLGKSLPGVAENMADLPRERRAPHIANLAFPRGISTEDLLVLFDRIGIAASPGAACSARALALSHVLRAAGLPDERIRRSIRFSFGCVTVAEAKDAARKIAETIRHRPAPVEEY